MTPELNPKALYDFALGEGRAISLFMPYDLFVTVNENIKIEIGRFSLSLFAKIMILPSFESGASLRIGAFCEAAAGSVILVGGDHSNSSLFNYSFGLYADCYRQFITPADLALGLSGAKPISIGDNVVISKNAMLVNEADVGSGCVIAAGAVVTGKCEPQGIYGGVPAKRIKNRFCARDAGLYREIDLQNIAAHALPGLPTKLSRLQAGQLSLEEFKGSVQYLRARPRVHMSAALAANGSISLQDVKSFSVGGTPVTDPSLVDQLQKYFRQIIATPKQLKWSPDIFHALGLC